MDKEQLKRHIRKSDLTALEKRYLEKLVDDEHQKTGMWVEFNRPVDTAPTVEAVEVVRCKDCKYLLKDNTERGQHLCMQNRYTRRNVNLDDYCSYGEKGDKRCG